MRTILYMAISADGFITGPNDETPWSDEEWAAFQEFVKSCDAVTIVTAQGVLWACSG